jgi:O-antigen/teichoic acid export membrane protein/aminoglycoside phosphotransferase (APT) family kinase protein
MTPADEGSHEDSRRRRHPFALDIPFVGAMLANPLTRNGYALVASFAITSVLGVVFWIVAARLYPQDQVGIGGVVVTTMVTLSSASQLGFGNWLNRELPVAGQNRARLILMAYSAGVTASLLLASVFFLAAPKIAPTLAQALDNIWLTIWFALAVAMWTVFALQDSVLAGLRLSVWVPAENAAYALINLALVTVSGLALFAAWTLPLLLLIIAVNLPIFLKVARPVSGEASKPIEVRRMVRLIGWDYAAGLALTAALGIAPILVLNQSGPDGSASYHLSWTITYALYLVGRSMGISLLAEGVASPGRLRRLSADALLHAMVPIVGAATVIALGAPLIMSLFGPGYAEQGSTILRLLALASIPWGCVTIQLALARVRGEMRMIFAVQTATLVLVVGLGLLLLPRFGPPGMALAWLLAHVLVLAGLVARHLRRSGKDGAIAFALDLATALADTVGKVRTPRRMAGTQVIVPEELQQMLEAIARPDATTWRPLKSVVSYSDSTVVFLGDPTSTTSTPRAVLKYSTSQEGMAALRRCLAGTAAVQEEVRHLALDFELPAVLASLDGPDLVASVETVIRGQDGRRALRGPDNGSSLRQAAAAIRAIHEARPEWRILDQTWGDVWIEGPIRRLSVAPAILLSPQARAQALRRLGDWQRGFWLGRKEKLGRGHGDCTPDNLMYEDAPGGPRLSGILDWEQTRPDALADLDLALLILTMRMHDQAGQMGDVVRQMLDTPALDAGERLWAGGDAEAPSWHDPDRVRAIIGLAWLRHVAANLEKSHHYGRNRLWLAHNVDWVLRKFAREP